MGTRFQDLNLSNYFLFAAAAEDEEISRLLLETLLGITVGPLKVKVEHSLLYNGNYRSIRLDVYLGDMADVRYNLEMENRERRSLPQRSRYHQAEMDVLSLKPGQKFSELKPVYVVFICTFDPFGHGLYRYTFENRCAERNFFPLEDGAVRVFLSTKGTNDAEVPEELVHLLHYVDNSTDEYANEVDDPVVSRIHGRVRELKRSRDWEARYMLLQEWIEEEREESMEEGRKEGFSQALQLIEAMKASGDADQIPRLLADGAFLEEMLAKYRLQDDPKNV